MGLKEYWQKADKNRLKKLLHWLGSLLAVGGIGFVILRLHDYADKIDLSRLNKEAWLLLLACLVIYGTAQFLLGKAWHLTLRHLGVAAGAVWAMQTYGTSQLAKYLPGNIFHFAGRQAIGMAKGYPGIPLLRSTVWELFLQCAAGALFSCLALPLLFPELAPAVGLVLFFAAFAFALYILHRLFDARIMAALCCDCAFLIISGLVFTAVLGMLLGGQLTGSLSAITVCGAFVTAWLAGFVIPGAPAGAGVRELVLLFLFRGQVPEGELLVALVLSRGVTVGGDVLFYLLSLLLAATGRAGKAEREATNSPSPQQD